MVVEMLGRPTASGLVPEEVNQFSLRTDIVEGKEWKRVTVPGVTVQEGDREFVAGVYWGRTSYFDDVYRHLDEMGNEVHTGTLEEFAALQEVKVRDISAADAIHFIMETAGEQACSKAWNAGFIFGYITACSDQFYGLICDHCCLHVGECDCREELEMSRGVGVS